MLPNVEPGSFLIAGPGLTDPNFQRSVVLLCDHGTTGSLGLVVNRPLNTPLAQIFPELAQDKEMGYVFNGGPVETQRVMALRQDDADDHETDQPVFDNVRLVVAVDSLVPGLRASGSPAEEYRFFVGYAGWGAGQLEAELEEGAWIVGPADPEVIFRTHPTKIWSSALRSLGGEYRLLAEMPLDPNLN